MVRYTFSCENPSQQYIQIQAIIPVEKEETIVLLETW